VLLRLAPNVSRDAHDERELALDETEQETADAGAKIVAQYLTLSSYRFVSPAA
jgi:hypothetical protein